MHWWEWPLQSRLELALCLAAVVVVAWLIPRRASVALLAWARWLVHGRRIDARQDRVLNEIAGPGGIFFGLQRRVNLLTERVFHLERTVGTLGDRLAVLEADLDAIDPVVAIEIRAFIVDPETGAEEWDMASEFTDEQRLSLQVVGVTAGGREKPAPGPISWSTDQGAIDTPDQPSAILTPPVVAADTPVTVSVSANGFTASEVETLHPAPVVGVAIKSAVAP